MIPTRFECEKMWDELALPGNLRAHLSAVAGLSAEMGTALFQNGFSLDIPLLKAAALLHDIKKGTPHHDAAGADFLRERGFYETAPIVAAHMRLPDNFRPEINERTIVFLADKYFIGSRLVTLEERYKEKMLAFQDNPKLQKIIKNQLKMAQELEQEIKKNLVW